MRIKRAVIKKKAHKKILKLAKGYRGARSRRFKTANEALMHAGKYAHRDRRQKKRDFRKLWIERINAACRICGISYSKFINLLNKNNVKIDRKNLQILAVENFDVFKLLVNSVSQ
ncbi:MAG: 50S ribosomal protein L20 [Candidatus Calescibacterium sp.]|nr:50S ribosomal protein L20 [Candidatus Calescibacterium sp.]MDW8132702.1 50S ribosomal protein L20 [Candidatus Calescibacterium sp.]